MWAKMGRAFRLYLTGSCIYGCNECGSHLTAHGELISTSFRGRTGPAWLFGRVINVNEGQYEDRMMTTGKHTIVDIYCNSCGTNLGWKYESACDGAQKYKEGKFILEKALPTLVETDDHGREHSYPLRAEVDAE